MRNNEVRQARLLATFDWEYMLKRRVDGNGKETWLNRGIYKRQSEISRWYGRKIR